MKMICPKAKDCEENGCPHMIPHEKITEVTETDWGCETPCMCPACIPAEPQPEHDFVRDYSDDIGNGMKHDDIGCRLCAARKKPSPEPQPPTLEHICAECILTECEYRYAPDSAVRNCTRRIPKPPPTLEEEILELNRQYLYLCKARDDYSPDMVAPELTALVMDAIRRVVEGNIATVWHESNEIKVEIDRRRWITEGRGCYQYNDDRYRDETKLAFEAIEERISKLQDALLKIDKSYLLKQLGGKE